MHASLLSLPIKVMRLQSLYPNDAQMRRHTAQGWPAAIDAPRDAPSRCCRSRRHGMHCIASPEPFVGALCPRSYRRPNWRVRGPVAPAVRCRGCQRWRCLFPARTRRPACILCLHVIEARQGRAGTAAQAALWRHKSWRREPRCSSPSKLSPASVQHTLSTMTRRPRCCWRRRSAMPPPVPPLPTSAA